MPAGSPSPPSVVREVVYPRSVTLIPEDVAEVERVGRRVYARYKARQVAQMRYREPDLERITNSFGGELAVARATGLPWHHGDPSKPDVGDHEVRYTGGRPELRVYDPHAARSQDRGKMDRVYVLTTGRRPTFLIHGWAHGAWVIKTGEGRRSPEGVMSFYLDGRKLRHDAIPGTTVPGEHLHAWARDGEEWACTVCGAPFVA